MLQPNVVIRIESLDDSELNTCGAAPVGLVCYDLCLKARFLMDILQNWSGIRHEETEAFATPQDDPRFVIWGWEAKLSRSQSKTSSIDGSKKKKGDKEK